MKNNVFLIDDDKNILTSISMLLENEGYKVSTFSDGESGLKAILENSPDIAVVDIKMPRLDGIELLKKLRRTSNMPVIFLTSKDTEIDASIFLSSSIKKTLFFILNINLMGFSPVRPLSNIDYQWYVQLYFW